MAKCDQSTHLPFKGLTRTVAATVGSTHAHSSSRFTCLLNDQQRLSWNYNTSDDITHTHLHLQMPYVSIATSGNCGARHDNSHLFPVRMDAVCAVYVNHRCARLAGPTNAMGWWRERQR